METHPTPWQVRYDQKVAEWHAKACPYIVDADGAFVCQLPQNEHHPGNYDETADRTACRIVTAVNALAEAACVRQAIRDSVDRQSNFGSA